MGLDDQLRARPDLEEEDVPGIIARAQALQDAALEAEERLSDEEVKAVSRELDLEDRFVDQAIRELRQERAAEGEPAEVLAAAVPQAPVNTRLRLALVGVVLTGFLLAWLALSGDFSSSGDGEPAVRAEPSPPEVTELQPAEARVAPAGPSASPEQTGWSLGAPLPADHSAAVAERLSGSWVLTAYLVRGKDQLIEVPLGREKPTEDRERWQFLEGGRFRHTLGDGLAFSGRVAPSHEAFLAPPWSEGDVSAQILSLAQVGTSFGKTRPADHYLAWFRGEDLVLCYLGGTLDEGLRPGQGNVFRRSASE